LDDEGEIASLMRNDKCASGSGRFLEMMSRKLLVDIADIDAVVDRAAAPVSISNQCAVFAESEAISHVNENETPADILAGICQAVANIVAAQCRRFGLADRYTITGGVARFRAVTDRLGDKLSGAHRRFPFDPRLATAIGAALLLDED
jgi:predicted CoA-substrate-specific enzyme activase